MSARAEAVKALHARGVRLCRFKRNAEGEKIALDAEGLKGCALEKALAWEGLLGILAGDLGLGTIDQDHGGAEAREALHRLIPNPLHWYETTKEPSKSHSLYLADKDVLITRVQMAPWRSTRAKELDHRSGLPRPCEKTIERCSRACEAL